jgi:CRP/FNR family transcriptional regulator, polysaccharide utilization system transcription regulator
MLLKKISLYSCIKLKEIIQKTKNEKMSTILVIEDNVSMRENTSELLELAGYNVVAAVNGKEGLDLARKNNPDLILCDIMMPELDGYGVRRALENIPDLVGVPFVYLSAKAEKSDFRFGMDLGADDYLTKPFTGDDLLKVVAARIKKSQLIKNKNNNIEGLNNLMNEAKAIKDINDLSNNRTIKKLRSKDILFMEGDAPNYLYFVVSGQIKTFRTNEWGKDYIMEISSAGDSFGYTALLNEANYRESAAAIEDTEIALIPKSDFYQLLYSNNEVSLKFIKFITNNLLEAEDRLIKLAYDSARKKVAEAILFLYRKSQPIGENEFFSVQRENLSSIAGIAPESISRNLTDFKDEGLIESGNGILRILNLKKLEALKN